MFSLFVSESLRRQLVDLFSLFLSGLTSLEIHQPERRGGEALSSSLPRLFLSGFGESTAPGASFSLV